MNEQIKNKLVALEAQVDAKLFAVMRGPDGKWYREDGTEANSVDDFKSLKGAAVAAGATGAGLGALAGDRAIMNNYGGGGSGSAVRGAAYRSAGRDAMETGRFYGGKVMDAGSDGLRAGQRSFRATKPGAIGNKAGNMGLFGRLRKALGTGARIATGGRLKFAAEIKERLVELAENLDRLDSRAKGAAIGGTLVALPGALVGAGVGQVAGRNKKKKLSQRDRAMLAGSMIGVPGVLGAHVLVPRHEYAATKRLVELAK
jgi:hypothetical protein